MSLYTPVFPQTNPPPARTLSSSSLTSAEAAKKSTVLSYSYRLSQWHLAIATLPDELCPPSAPTSPSSRTRSEKLQADIEQAVRDGRSTSDFCKLRSSRIGYATMQPSTGAAESISQQDKDVPWILAETEEEWLEWERVMAERRAKSNKEHVLLMPPIAKSQNTREKVLSWKAQLLPPGSSATTAFTGLSANSGRSPLGFPVIKRSSMFKESKLKVPSVIAPEENTCRVVTAEQRPMPTNVIEQPATKPIDMKAVNVSTANLDPSDANQNEQLCGAERILPASITDSKDEGVLVMESDEGRSSHLPDFSAFPPSFPSNLPTSTPKDIFSIPEEIPTFPPFPPNLPTSTPKDVVELSTVVVGSAEQEQRPQTITQHTSDCLGLGVVHNKQQPLHSTPPSPPDSSSDSPKLHPSLRQRAATTGVEFVAPTIMRPDKQSRPLTPPSEAGLPASFAMQSMPRTPERQPLKKHRTMPPENTPFGVGPTTPQSYINGAATIPGLALPRTPDRQTPAVDLLATSRRSKPRPRPPSRKQLAQRLGLDGAAGEDGGGEPSPAKSDRSYFSSPASGDSSGSSTRLVPGSPTSPLGFTQSPGRFAPIGVSTQASSKSCLARGRPGNSHIASPGSHRAGSERDVIRASSGLLGMTYNSQFDVDAHVDQLSNFLEQDVDFSAWVRDTDDEEDDAVAVEKLTFAASPVGL